MIRRVSGYENVYVLSYSVLYCCKRCKLNVLARYYSHRSRKLERVEPRGLQHEPQPDRHARLGQNAPLQFSMEHSAVMSNVPGRHWKVLGGKRTVSHQVPDVRSVYPARSCRYRVRHQGQRVAQAKPWQGQPWRKRSRFNFIHGEWWLSRSKS